MEGTRTGLVTKEGDRDRRVGDTDLGSPEEAKATCELEGGTAPAGDSRNVAPHGVTGMCHPRVTEGGTEATAGPKAPRGHRGHIPVPECPQQLGGDTANVPELPHRLPGDALWVSPQCPLCVSLLPLVAEPLRAVTVSPWGWGAMGGSGGILGVPWGR